MIGLTVSVSPIVFTGCGTLPSQTEQQKIVMSLTACAQIGGALILNQNPEWRSGIEKAVADLRILQNGTSLISVNDVLAILQRANIKELKSPEAALYVASGMLIVTQIGVPTQIDINTSTFARSIAGAIADGLSTALNVVQPYEPLPPAK